MNKYIQHVLIKLLFVYLQKDTYFGYNDYLAAVRALEKEYLELVRRDV